MVYYRIRITLLEGYIKIVPAEGVLHTKTSADKVGLLLKKTNNDLPDSLERQTIYLN
jgi:hypothetical protein